jgi:predicted transcriptional regulator
MSTQRFTITLPDDVGKLVRKKARDQKKPVSRVIAEAIEASERERVRQMAIEGYITTREESRRIAEEWWPIAGEGLPDD